MIRTTTEYAFRTRLDLPYEQAVANVTTALKNEGFSVLTEIDVKATLKQKLDVDFLSTSYWEPVTRLWRIRP